MGRKDVTVPMPAELNEQIEAELGYGDSKAEWIRTAIKMRLEDGAEGDAAAGEEAAGD